MIIAIAIGMAVAAATPASGRTALAIERIKASTADPRVPPEDQTNIVLRPAKEAALPPLVIFLPGTGGDPVRAATLLGVVAGQGYRAIGLAYPNEPAVQQLCPRVPDPNCAAAFREMRIWGTGGSTNVSNSVAESIVGRFVALIDYLHRAHPTERWNAYLTADRTPLWSRIIVSGLSQGAGMAAYIAKRERVARVVCFSSPIDTRGGSRGTAFAPWLTISSATPAERWYAVRHAREPFNPMLVRSYPALGIATDHVRVFNRDLPGGRSASDPRVFHGIGITDPAYADDWRFLYGKPSDIE